MIKLRISILSLLLSILFLPTVSGQDKLLEILKQELSQQAAELKKSEYPPYHMNYRVVDRQVTFIQTSFGALMRHSAFRQRMFVPQIRIGDKQFDNFKTRSMGAAGGFNGIAPEMLPLDEENNGAAIRQAIWNETNSRYQFAVDAFQNDKAKKTVNVEDEDKSPCFSDAPVEKYYEAPLSAERLVVDSTKWIARLKEVSAVFNKDAKIMSGDATLSFIVERRYFISSDGTEVVQNLPYARLGVNGQVKADDGMVLPLYVSYFAYDLKDLPDNKKIIEDTEDMIARLLALREAPMVDPYTGPALLAGNAAGVFFHEIFGHRIEGQRMKSESDGQTFKKMLGQRVLPTDLSVYDDPTLKRYRDVDIDLNGYYKYDDQGVKAERVDVVVDGKLNEFLMTRTPIDNHPRSNGHARAESGFDPVSRQSNLVIETKNPKTEAQLRQLLLEEVKKQGKEYGYYFTQVTSGFTMTGRGGTNAFNVTPLEVYKVYADGRPDELVRGVDLIGTPLSMFSNIIYAGDNVEVFTGMCGAESGYIPVTAISPMILVNKVEMQRKAKSQDLLPILGRPELKNK